jgi:hypothetical protein
MVETFTPAVCGSRSRQRLALVLFAVGALFASAALGALLGLAGSAIGTRLALIGAAVLAFLAALRETGLVLLPLPQSRHQVPEHWRSELPLPLWSTGYGAGLGVGFLTFQPVATFWVACAAALALGRPALAALCFAFYGAGRAFMAVWPRRRQADGPAAVERLVSRSVLIGRLNAAVLVLAVVMLALSPAAGAAVSSLGRGFDPSADGKTLARARMMGSGTLEVVVAPPAPNPVVPVKPASAPALDGNLLAYADVDGIKVIDWRNGSLQREITGNVSDPALAWPLLAFVRDDGSYERLILADLSNPSSPQLRRIATVRSVDDLGRPSLRGGRLAWHRIRHRGSSIFVYDVATGKRRVVERTKIWQESNPALSATRIAWVESRPAGSFLRVRRLGSGRTRTLKHMNGTKTFLWTTALVGRTAYVTRWTPSSGRSTLLRVTF